MIMDSKTIQRILEDVAAGRKKPAEALASLRDMPFADLEVAKHDSHRSLRNGFSEVILCQGKDEGHLVRIIGELSSRGVNVFGTRLAPEAGERIAGLFPKSEYDPVSCTFLMISRPVERIKGIVAVVSAGTADLPVAAEAKRTAEFFGAEVRCVSDVGVAGLHRLMGSIDSIRAADAVIAVAGMEGALPSVLGGLVASPIIAVPTSVGYGANLGGFTALLAMLNSCSEGIAVVNIDNGFGAACAALRIIRNRG